MIKSVFSVGDILRRTCELVLSNIALLGSVFILITALTVCSEQVSPSFRLGLMVLNTLLSIHFQVLITYTLMQRIGLTTWGNAWSHFGPVFMIALVSSLAIAAGLLILIIPGLYIGARWAIAVPAVISSPKGFSEAMTESWDKTSGNLWTVFASFIAIYAPAILLVGPVVLTEFNALEYVTSIWLSIVLNVAVSFSQVVGWVAAVALYERIAGQSHTDTEILT